MKKIIIISLLLYLGVIFNAAAQSSYIGFSLGTSIPGASFASGEDLFSDGYAISGFTVDFEGYYYPVRIVGVGGRIGFSSLYAGRDAYLEQLLDYAYNESDIPLTGSPPENEQLNFESGFWNYINLLIGPELSVPFGRFQAGIRAAAGISTVFYPERDLNYEDGSDQLTAFAKGPSLALAYSYGGSLLYRSRGGTGIKLNADYLKTSASYDFELELQSGTETFKESRTERVDIEALSITLGFYYVF